MGILHKIIHFLNPPLRVITFITYNEAALYKESNLGGLGGFFKDGMRWPDYLAIFKPKYHPQLENLRAAIIERNLRITGDIHQHDSDIPSCPVFSDGTVATYSYRAWGDLMAAIWSTHDNKDYSYMDFYC